MNLHWFMVWFEPQEGDHVAYMTQHRIAECGGTSVEDYKSTSWARNAEQLNQGVAVLTRWCRLNCTSIPAPVNVRGKTGFAFNNIADALLFKLTWG